MKNSFIDFIKRDLLLGIVLSAIVFASALVLGGPFLAKSRTAVPSTPAAMQASVQTTTLTGTVLRDGRHVFLNPGDGNLYRLVNVPHARPYAGKTVTVTGQVDPQTRQIYVDRIQTVSA